MREVVVNSSPLIALSGLHQLDILQRQRLYGEIYIPEAVYKEVSAKQESVCKQSVDDSKLYYISDALVEKCLQAVGE